MHIEMLRVFCDLADLRSFSRTAEKHLLSQSAVSQQLAQLEMAHKCQLIDRKKRPIELTKAGQSLYQAAKDILERYEQLKNELAAEFCAVLAFAAIRNNDKVGLIIFTDQIELYIPPKKGTSHVLRLIRELLHFKIPNKKTDIPLALDYLGKVIGKRATVFLVSDFIADDYFRPLSLVNKRHDVIAVTVRDRTEMQMPRAGLIEFEDAETGNVRLIDSSQKAFGEYYRKQNQLKAEMLYQQFRSINIDSIDITTDRPYINDLVKFFHMRHKRA